MSLSCVASFTSNHSSITDGYGPISAVFHLYSPPVNPVMSQVPVVHLNINHWVIRNKTFHWMLGYYLKEVYPKTSQQNSIATFSLTTEVAGDLF